MKHSKFTFGTLLALILSLATVGYAGPVITLDEPDGGETYPVVDLANFAFTVVTDTVATVSGYSIFFSNDSSSWALINSGAGGGNDTLVVSYNWPVPVAVNDSCWIMVTSTDSNDSLGSVTSNRFEIIPRTETFTYPDGWTLMSIPLIPVSDSSIYIIGDDLEHNWAIYGFQPDEGYSWAHTMEVGEGYFLGFDEFEEPVTFDVTGIPVTDDSVTVELAIAWNVVASPFRSTAPLADATFWFDGTPYNYDDAVDSLIIHPVGYTFVNSDSPYVASDELDAWRAYWFLVLKDDVTMVLYPTLPHPAPGRDGADEGTVENWNVELTASLEGRIDNAVFGVNPRAHNGFDNRFDWAEPPTLPEQPYVRLFYARSEWDSPAGVIFQKDIRRPLGRGESAEWIVTVSPSQAGNVTLSWGNLAPWNNSYTLIDGDARIDMRNQESYSFNVRGDKTLTIRVQSALDVGSPEVSIPTDFGITSVTPNPFNNRARVSFDLPTAGNIELSIVDMSGRSVMTLAKGSFNSGRHSVAIDGEALAGGSYIVRLESAGQISTAKLTLLK
jgi:hypothetical protein